MQLERTRKRAVSNYDDYKVQLVSAFFCLRQDASGRSRSASKQAEKTGIRDEH